MNIKELYNTSRLADMATLSALPNPLEGLKSCVLQMESEGDSALHKTIHFKCYIPKPKNYEYCFRVDLAGNHFQEKDEHLPKDINKYLKAIKKWLKEKPVTKSALGSIMPTNLEWVVDSWYRQNQQYERYELSDLIDKSFSATPLLLSLIAKGEI